MEDHRNPTTRDDFLEKFFKLQADVQRLTEHEAADRPKYERWYKEFVDRFTQLEKLRLETANGRLKDLENRPIVVQISEVRIKELFDERAELREVRDKKERWGKIWSNVITWAIILALGGVLTLILQWVKAVR